MRYRMEDDRPARRKEKEVQLELRASSLLILLGILAVVCGLFYALGYTIGRHSAPQTFSLNPAPPPVRASSSSVLTPGSAQPPNPIELSAAEQGKTPAMLTPAPTPVSTVAPVANTNTPPAAPSSTRAALASTSTPAQPAPLAPALPTPASHAAAGSAFVVQVFAGVMRNDAYSLAAALKARQYPVFVVVPSAGENLYRVQVGPYATLQQASAMRARLLADGYNAVVKNKN